MDFEALWSVEFGSNVGFFGAGVAVLETDRIFGGDAQYFYVGSYRTENQRVLAKIDVTHYSGPGLSIFGPLRRFTILLEQTADEVDPASKLRQMTFTGRLEDNPARTLVVKLTWRAALP